MLLNSGSGTTSGDIHLHGFRDLILSHAVPMELVLFSKMAGQFQKVQLQRL
jgi:hypothetical protein